MIVEGGVNLICVCVPDENADLRISGVKSISGDYVEITNFGKESKNLSEYCLTDNSTTRKSALPETILAPGEALIIYCKNYTETEVLGKPVTNFNIKTGETVSLYRTSGELIDSVEVPQLGSNEGVWQMDKYSGEFKEIIRKQ